MYDSNIKKSIVYLDKQKMFAVNELYISFVIDKEIKSYVSSLILSGEYLLPSPANPCSLRIKIMLLFQLERFCVS